MADQQGPAAVFPTPPPFYQHFTKENLSRLRQLRRDAAFTSDSTIDEAEKRDIDVLALPTELRYLLPPEPPASGTYESFGQQVNLNPPEITLADAGIEQLYPSHPSVRLDPRSEMIRLARSMLTSYLALTGILSENPELYEKTVEDLQVITFNIHDLINQYRPHQARETLILMMEERLAEMKDEIKKIDESKEKVWNLLQDLQTNGTAQALQEDQVRTEKKPERNLQVVKRKMRQRGAWAALEKEMG